MVRNRAKRGVSNHGAAPSFEIHRRAMLLRMRRKEGAAATSVLCYVESMTKLLERAIEAALKLPPDEQDDIARAIMRLAGADDSAPVALTDDERAAIARSKAAAARGEFATDEEVRAVWAKHG
jgi:hypothetical protein